MTSRTFTFTVSSSSGPSWFSELAPLTWLPIATGTNRASGTNLRTGGDRLDQVTYTNSHVWPSPSTYVGKPSIYGSPNNYCQNSNGAAVDPVNAEMFLVSNGGHGGYMGNETMRLRLKTDTPSWEIFVDSTPPDYLPPSGTNPDTGNTGAFWSDEVYAYKGLAWSSYLDGPAYATPVTTGPVARRPASTHTACLATYSEGKVWYSLQSSTNLNGGTSTCSKYALNVQSVRDTPSLKNWAYGQLAPWEFYGVPQDGGNTQINIQGFAAFSGSALDPATGRIWTPYSSESSLSARVMMLETRGANAGQHQFFDNTAIHRIGSGNCPRIITVTDTDGEPKKLLVTISTKRYTTSLTRYVIVVDITALEAQTITYSGVITTPCVSEYTVTEPTPIVWHPPEAVAAGRDTAGTWGPGPGWGLVYHAPSNAFLAFNCDHSVNSSRVREGSLRKLSLPLNDSGQYDPVNYDWTWTTVAVSGVVPTTCIPGGVITGGSWSRFNVVPQFDGTNDLLIALNSYNTATSVMKLPPTAL
jgi:hypothetical protein